MDYRLINTLEDQPGWKALNKYIEERQSEIDKSLIDTIGLHNEATRLEFSKIQGEYRALRNIQEIVKNPSSISNYFESDLPRW